MKGQCKISGLTNCKAIGTVKETSNDYFFSNSIPPEFYDPLIQIKTYDQSYDYWSLGTLVFAILTAKDPFRNELELKEKQPQDIRNPEEFLKGSSNQAYEFVQSLLNKNPVERLGSVSNKQNIKEVEFFKEIDWSNLENIGSLCRPPKVFANYYFRAFNVFYFC